MALKMPTKISLKWWKDNYPNSMPTNKDVEKLLKEASTITRADCIEQVKTLLEKSNDIPMDRLKPDYPSLLEALKRSKATVTKAKHDDFVKGIDEMIELVRREKAALTEEVKALVADSRKRPTAFPRTLEKQVAGLDRDYEAPLKRLTAALKSTSTGLRNADEDALTVMIGKNRFMQAKLKVMQRNAKALETALVPHASAELALDARMRVLEFMVDMKEMQKAALALDKGLVTRAIAVLGDVKGKKLFLTTKEHAVHMG